MWKQGRKDGRSQRGCRTPGEHDPLSQPSRAHTGSQRMNQQARGIHGYTPGLLHEYMLWLLAWCSCESPHSGSECVFDSFASSWDFSSYLLPCLASLWGLLPCLIVVALSGLFIDSWRPALFWRETGGVNLGERGSREELGGVEGEEAVVGVYCMREEEKHLLSFKWVGDDEGPGIKRPRDQETVCPKWQRLYRDQRLEEGKPRPWAGICRGGGRVRSARKSQRYWELSSLKPNNKNWPNLEGLLRQKLFNKQGKKHKNKNRHISGGQTKWKKFI